MTVEFSGSSLTVQGALRGLGTASQPITLTGTVDTPGAWVGLRTGPGALVALSYTTVSDAGAYYIDGCCAAVSLIGSTATLDHVTVTRSSTLGIGIEVTGGKVTISNSTITHASTALGVYSGTVDIHNSVIADDSYGISCSDCTSVHAENNYWGTPSGPAPYGSGPGVSYHQESYTDPTTNATRYYNVVDVAVEPWLGETTALRQQNGPSGNGEVLSASAGFDAGSANNDTASVAEPVNTASGSYEYSHTDLSLAGRTPLVFGRSYNSRTAAVSPGPLGYGWTFTYGVSLTTPDNGATVLVTFGTGRTDVFTRQSDGGYSAAPGQFDALTANGDGTYDVRDKMQTDYHFNGAGALLAISDHNGNATTLGYNGNGQLTTVAVAGGRSFTLAYNGDGRITSVTDNSGRTVSFAYAPAGDRTGVTDALGHVTTTGYDAVGRPTSVTDALGHTTTLGYDASDDVTSSTDALGHSTTTVYDGESNRSAVTGPRGYTTQYTYDGDNRLTTVTDALGQATRYGYDAVGNRITVTDARGHTTVTAYDVLERVTSVTSPLSETVGYGYDAAGNRTSVVNARGHTTTYGYDAANRLMGIAYVDGSSVTYAYDTASRRTSMVDGTGTTSYAYDADSRPISITQPAGTVTYSYDLAGNRATLGMPSGKTVTYAYDAVNRLISVTDWHGGVTTMGYDAIGRTSAATYINGVTAAYSYDAANHPLGLVYNGQGSTLDSFGYTYDANGNRQTASDSSGTTTYGYDALDRLTSAQAPSGSTGYGYDAAGNRTTLTTSQGATAYSYNEADELTGAGSMAAAYDPDGNRVSSTNGATVTSYSYDDANYLTGVSTGVSSATYQYNGDHARVGSAVNGTTTSYLLDLAAPLPVVLQQATSGVTTTYLYGNGLLAQEIGAAMQTLLPDALGSTRLVTDGSGAVIGHSTYDAYGTRTTSGTGSAFGFTGQQADAASGLLYLRARYYDPATGVFLQRDPYPFQSGNPVTIDRYTYVGDNPTTIEDPSGASWAWLEDVPGVGDIMRSWEQTRRASDAYANEINNTDYSGESLARAQNYSIERETSYAHTAKELGLATQYIPGTSLTGDVPVSKLDVGLYVITNLIENGRDIIGWLEKLIVPRQVC